MVRLDTLAKLLHLLDLSGQVVGEGVFERLFEKSVSDAIEVNVIRKQCYLGLCGRVAAHTVQGGSLHHGLRDGRAQSGSTNSEGGSHCDQNQMTKEERTGYMIR